MMILPLRRWRTDQGVLAELKIDLYR